MPALFSKQESCNYILWVGRDLNPLTARPIRQFVFRLDLQSSAVTYPNVAMVRGIEPLFEPAMPPVLPLDDTIEKLLSHKVLLAASPSFDYRVPTCSKASYLQCFNALGTLWFCTISWNRTKFLQVQLPGDFCVSADLHPDRKNLFALQLNPGCGFRFWVSPTISYGDKSVCMHHLLNLWNRLICLTLHLNCKRC